MEDDIDQLNKEKTEERRKEIGRLHIRVGYWYDQLARKELERLGEKPPKRFMLVEGAGKIAVQRIKQYGVKKVCEMLKEYIASEKKGEERIALEKKLADYAGADRVITSHEVIEDLKKYQAPPIRPTKLARLDKFFGGGVEDGEMILIGGYPGNGKTQLGVDLTRRMEEQKVLYLSFELNARQFMRKFNYMPPLFYTPAQMTNRYLDWVEERILEAIVKYDIKIVFLDNFQAIFMLDSYRNSTLQIGQMAYKLAEIAKLNNITLFVMCNVQKQGRETFFLEHEMGDIRESGDLLHAAHTIFFIQRVPNEFQLYAKRRKPFSLEETDNRAMIKIVKNRREGTLGKFLVELRMGSFYEVDEIHKEPEKEIKMPYRDEEIDLNRMEI